MDQIVFAILASCCLLGWLRVYRAPGDVFRQAEVIVVAHVVPDTVRMYPVVVGVQDFAAILRVMEVLKGAVAGQEVAIVLHHGLTPVVGGYLREGLTTIDAGHRRAGVIEIYDTGSSAVSFEPFVADAREDHIWLLSRHADYWTYRTYCPVPEYAGQLGIAEPDEVLPLSEREAVIR